METDKSAQMFFERELKKEVQSLRRDFFQIIDSLKVSDVDNHEDLSRILNDDDLAKKFILLTENKHAAIRKIILDATGNLERSLVEYTQNFDITFKRGTEIKTTME